MDRNDVKELAVKLAAMTDRFEARGDQVVQRNSEAARHLQQAAQHVTGAIGQATTLAMADVRGATKAALTEGLYEPVHDMDETLQKSARQVEAATDRLAQRIEWLRHVHTANAWKGFIASAVASLVLIGIAVYMGIQAHRDIERSEWISDINAAIANGKLAACQGGGICAHVDKKWVRLDK